MTTLPMTPRAALATRRIVNLDQVACGIPSVVADGAAAGCRAVDCRVAGGVDLRVLPDRGLDVGAAWFGGVPLSWTSPRGECGPLDGPTDGAAWLDRFGGGLITTCGLRNVGSASEGHGLHGVIHHTPAGPVTTTRTVGDDGEVTVTVSATVDETAGLTGHLRLDRTVSTRTGGGHVDLVDTVTNLGDVTEAAPLLYHINLGAPLWSDGAQVSVTADRTVPRDDATRAAPGRWDEAPDPAPGAPERVVEHLLRPDPDGRATATVINAALGLEVEVAWIATTLPRCHQWVHPSLGVLGIEPANCSVLGRVADRRAGTLPTLEPGQARTTRLQVRARSTAVAA